MCLLSNESNLCGWMAKDRLYIHFEITGDHCNLIGSQWCVLFSKPQYFFCSKSHSCFKLHNVFSKSHHCFAYKMRWNWAFPIPLFLTIINKPATGSTEYCYWLIFEISCGCNKVVMALSIVQFLSEMILRISTRASSSSDF